jgi:acyl carrier protein
LHPRSFNKVVIKIPFAINAVPAALFLTILKNSSGKQPFIAFHSAMSLGESQLLSLREHARVIWRRTPATRPASEADSSPGQVAVVVEGALLDVVEEAMQSNHNLTSTISTLWKTILERQDIGLADTFSDLGGHSLRAVVLVQQIKDATGVSISARDILYGGSIQSCVEKVKDALELEGADGTDR